VIKEGIIRALTARQARGVADGWLIAEFRRLGPADGDTALSLKWAIGNALSVVADMTRRETAEAIYDLGA
jgi:hypothetical protein